MFWNVQRLFEHGPSALRAEIDATSSPGVWTAADVATKIVNLCAVIDSAVARFGPLLFLGVTEVETRELIRRIGQGLNTPLTSADDVAVDATGNSLVGVNLGLLIDRTFFDGSISVRSHIIDRTFDTRDVLECQLESSQLDTPVCILLNHWPSRLASEGEEKRIAAAHYLRALFTDKVRFSANEMLDAATGRLRVPRSADLSARASTPVIVAGDFNDEPFDPSIDVLVTTPDTDTVVNDLKMSGRAQARRYREYRASTPRLHNPFWRYATGSDGSYWRSPRWRTYDQIMVSRGLLKGTGSALRYVPGTATTYTAPDLLDAEGNPIMTTRAGKPAQFDRTTGRGCSDHFPVVAQFEIP